MGLDNNYDWWCFVFDTSLNRAKKRVADEFYCDYIDMRCKTLKKGVNISIPMLVTHPDDNGYDIVFDYGFHYATEDEEWIPINKPHSYWYAERPPP